MDTLEALTKDELRREREYIELAPAAQAFALNKNPLSGHRTTSLNIDGKQILPTVYEFHIINPNRLSDCLSVGQSVGRLLGFSRSRANPGAGIEVCGLWSGRSTDLQSVDVCQSVGFFRNSPSNL